MHSWHLFLLTKAYKGFLYLIVIVEKSLDIFTLLFLLENSKIQKIVPFQDAFLFAVATPTLGAGWSVAKAS